MAGYKQTMIDEGARMFLTFDGDAYDSNNRNLVASPETIIDESGNGNDAILHNASVNPFGYRMGLPSLVEREPSDQYSMAFGYYGKQGSSGNDDADYPKSFLEVPHSASFDFGYNGYTIEFFMKKEGENEYRQTHTSFDRPIIRKDGVINFWLNYYAYRTGSYSFRLLFPGEDDYVEVNDSSIGAIGQTVHVAITYEILADDTSGLYNSYARLYVNGKKFLEKVVEYEDIPPYLTQNTPWEIAGRINSQSLLADRNTSALWIDQLAMFKGALSPDEIGRHYRKARYYDTIIKADHCSYYWRFEDQNNVNDWKIYDTVGGIDGYYNGTSDNITRDVVGPEILEGSRAAYFSKGAQGVITKTSSGCITPVFQTSSSYTVEFWASIINPQEGVLFTMMQNEKPFQGVTLEVNKANGIHQPGSLQFSENENTTLSTGVNLNDGLWHHYALIRRVDVLEVWFDGVMVASSSDNEYRSLSNGGQIFVFNARPGYKFTEGSFAKLAIYGHALQEQQIRIRSTNTIYYLIKGIVTLQGVPTRADIRIYNHNTGKLIDEIQSDINTGEYKKILFTNEKVDVMVYSREDQNIRYRAFGPITPVACEDPITTVV